MTLLSYITPTTLAIALAFTWTMKVIYNIAFHPIRKIPGPFLAKYSQLWRNICYFRGTWHDDCLRLHERYGLVVRIAPNEVSVTHPDAFKALYGHAPSILKTKSYNSWLMPSVNISSFVTQDPVLNLHLRSRISGAYTMTSILSMEDYLQDVADLNWEKFRRIARTSQEIDLGKWTAYFTFDVVGELGLGGAFGFLDVEDDFDGVIAAIKNGFWLMANLANVPLQSWWINNAAIKWIVRHFGGKELNAFDHFLEWLDNRVETRMHAEENARKDLMQYFIDAKDMNKQPVTKADVASDGMNLVAAGADTTSIALCAVIGNVILRPHVLLRLQAEIDAAYTRLGLENTEISYKEAVKLPYLSAVIKESMRLHPSIQYQLPRYVPEGGVQVGKYFLPAGTECGISPGSMNRSKAIYGVTANEFQPERWIPSEKISVDEIRYMDKHFSTFGAGNRVCAGQNLALLEIFKYVTQFFRHFEAEIMDEDQPWKRHSAFLTWKSDFMVKLHERFAKDVSTDEKAGLTAVDSKLA